MKSLPQISALSKHPVMSFHPFHDFHDFHPFLPQTTSHGSRRRIMISTSVIAMTQGEMYSRSGAPFGLAALLRNAPTFGPHHFSQILEPSYSSFLWWLTLSFQLQAHIKSVHADHFPPLLIKHITASQYVSGLILTRLSAIKAISSHLTNIQGCEELTLSPSPQKKFLVRIFW